jgi:glycine cleavage system pyridoxal-binding protein P
MTTETETAQIPAVRESTDPRLAPTDVFVPRHIGPSEDEVHEMLALLGVSSLEELIDQTIPKRVMWIDLIAERVSASEEEPAPERPRASAGGGRRNP